MSDPDHPRTERRPLVSAEHARMLRGELYDASDQELVAGRARARRLCRALGVIDPEDIDRRRAGLEELLGSLGARTVVEPPFICDYGTQISLADDVFINVNCVFLDAAAIRIGSQTQLGPAVQLYTSTHPLDAATRVAGPELAKPITIGSRVWIGGGAIVLPGVSIGDDTVVGAGSVVTRSLPARVVAAGNPCRVLRPVGDRR